MDLEVTAVFAESPGMLFKVFLLHIRSNAAVISEVLILLSMCSLVGAEQPSFANLSALSFPGIPQWLGIHIKLTLVPDI